MSSLVQLYKSLQPNQRAAVFRLPVLYSLLSGGFFLGRMARDALFFAAIGAKWLPVAFVANAIVIFFAGARIGAWQDRRGLKRSMFWGWSVSAAVALVFAVVFQFVLPTESSPERDIPVGWLIVYFLFFAFFELPYLALTASFWSYAGAYFNDRQQGRLFPVFTCGAHIGTFCAGIFALYGVRSFGATALIFAWVGTLLVGLPVLRWMWHTPPGEKEEQADLSDREGFRAIFQYDYAVTFMVITFCTFFVMSIFDYSLADTFNKQYGKSPDDVAEALGEITVWFGVVAFFLQLLAVPRLVESAGVERVNLVAPTLLTIGGLVLLGFYSVTGASVARGLFLVNEFVFNQTLLAFIYGAVPASDRTQVRSTIEGTVTNLALALGGMFLLLPLIPNFPWWLVPAAGTVGAIVMLERSVKFIPQYRVLRRAKVQIGTETDDIDTFAEWATLGEAEQIQKCRRGLTSGFETTVALTLRTLRKSAPSVHGDPRVWERVVELCRYPNRQIRVEAINTAARLADSDEKFQRVQDAMRYPATVRGARRFRFDDTETLHALTRLYGPNRRPQLQADMRYLLAEPLGDGDALQLLMSLFLSEPCEGHAVPRQWLERMVNADEAHQQAIAASVLSAMPLEAQRFATLLGWARSEAEPERGTGERRIAALQAIAAIAAREANANALRNSISSAGEA